MIRLAIIVVVLLPMALLAAPSVRFAGEGPLQAAEWEDQRVTSENRLPSRADLLPESRFVESLNGTWRFHWSPTPERRPCGFERTDFDDAAWTTIDVPSCVEMRGWGIPLYVHVGYPFPKNPPFVNHADNPVSSYRRTFSVPSDWRGRRVILRFEGVASAFYVWVNGRRIGYSEDSFGIAEFDITSVVARDGENVLCVEVYRWSDGSYIEDQDAFRFSGIFRDVKLWSLPEDGIRDLRVETKPMGGYENWRLTVEIECRGRQRTEASLYDADQKKVADLTPFAESTFGLSLKPHLWSAENPYLYTLVVRRGSDEVRQRIGFREVKIDGNRFLVNGRPVVFRGVNRHASDPENGWAVTDALTEADVLTMKRHNIDTIRTSHHPDRPVFYDLCDRLGIYVIAEANVEAHGLGSHGTNCVGTLPGWEIPIVERNVNQVRRHRNHPCVVMWSLGNESGPGPAFAAALAAVRKLDPTRPVHYESDEKVSDVRSVMYPSVKKVCDHARDRDKPFFVCEYAHSMGNALGNFAEYMDAFLSGPATCGGCVWDWSDQAVWKSVGGKRFLAYGGDWGEKADGSYCCNGLMDPLRHFSPKLAEVAHVYRKLAVRRTHGGFELVNRHAWTRADAFAGRWELLEDGVAVRSGSFDVPPVGPGDFGPVPALDEIAAGLPDSPAERFLNVSFLTKGETAWAKRGFVVAREQLALGGETKGIRVDRGVCRPSVSETGNAIAVACGRLTATFDRTKGTLSALTLDGRPVLAKSPEAGPRLGVARAYVDNDVYLRQRNKRSPKELPTFRESGLERLSPTVRSVVVRRQEEGSIRVVCDVRMKGTGAAGFDHLAEWTFDAMGRLTVRNEIRPFGTMPILMRVGTECRLDPAFECMTWYGRGPFENYVDRRTAAFVGRYDSTVADQYVGYVRPQDCGYKTDVRWVAFTNADGCGIRFSCDRPLLVQALHYSRQDLDGARHWKGEPARNNLPSPRPEVFLNLDVRQTGLGNASCGPRPLDSHIVRAQPETWTLSIEPYRRESNPSQVLPSVRFAGEGTLQAALNAGAGGRVTVAKGVWKVDPGFVHSDTEIVFETGAELEANPKGFFGVDDCVLTVSRQTNVVIRGGTIRMHRQDYLAKRDGRPRSQHRHGVSLRGAVNVRVEDVRFLECGGDGVYVANADREPCRHITVRNVFCDHPLRQSMSVIDVDGLLIENCTFQRALGENPQAGIDFEPNHPWQRLKGIVMRNCRLEGNARNAIDIYVTHLDDTTEPVDMRFEHCTTISNRTGFGLSMNRRLGFPPGRIIVTNCLFKANREQGINIGQKPSGCLALEVVDTRVDDSCRELPERGDIHLLSRYDWDNPVDDILFRNVTVVQSRKGPWIRYENRGRGAKAIANVRGDVTVTDTEGRTVRHTLASADCERIFPRPPGAPVTPQCVDWQRERPSPYAGRTELQTVYARGRQHFAFYVDRARRVAFEGGLRGDAWTSWRPTERPGVIELRKFGCRNWRRGKLAEVALPVRRGDFAFEVPSEGWYLMSLASGKSGFLLYASEVPVWMSLGGKETFDPSVAVLALSPKDCASTFYEPHMRGYPHSVRNAVIRSARDPRAQSCNRRARESRALRCRCVSSQAVKVVFGQCLTEFISSKTLLFD